MCFVSRIRCIESSLQTVPCCDYLRGIVTLNYNPIIAARDVPTADESMLVIRFRNPKGIDMPYLLSMLADSFMSRANTIVCPGSKMPLAMQLIFTPMILQLIDRKKRG